MSTKKRVAKRDGTKKGISSTKKSTTKKKKPVAKKKPVKKTATKKPATKKTPASKKPIEKTPKKRGRPRKSPESESVSSKKKSASSKKPVVPDLKSVFDIDCPEDPLEGTPKEIQKDLDALALHIQKHPDDEDSFLKIVAYIHKYLLGLVFKKFSFVRGQEESDMYQEALIALSRKAIPKFDPTMGMSFLNFAKMCINRHLITILNASINRKKDYPMNYAVSFNYNPIDPEDGTGGNCTLSNIITDDVNDKTPYDEHSQNEAYEWTLNQVKKKLSPFETIVLEEYLRDQSYKEMAGSISKRTGVRFNEKSIDNALLRIRKKASSVLRGDKDGDMLF